MTDYSVEKHTRIEKIVRDMMGTLPVLGSVEILNPKEFWNPLW